MLNVRLLSSLILRRVSVLKRTMDDLSPPDRVRGMTVLDRGMFKKSVKIICVRSSVEQIGECAALLKGYALKLLNFRPVQALDEQTKIIYLDPRKINSYMDINENHRGQLSKLGIGDNSFFAKEFMLTYENWKADEILKAITPIDEDSVSGYSLIGHIVHLNLKPHLNNFKNIIGQVLLDKISTAKTVIIKVDSIDNQFRNFKMELIAGEENYVAKIKENNFQYELDFSQVYWNPRLSNEHALVVSSLKSGDVLFDICCGIGPFVIPASKKGVTVFANDLNTHSIKWLKRNLELNKIKTDVHVSNKDAVQYIKEDFKKTFVGLKAGDYKVLITINLPSMAPSFLSTFCNLYDENDSKTIECLPTPEVFVYCFVKNEENPVEAARKIVFDELGTNDQSVVSTPHFVRNVAPNKDMFRVPVRLIPRILLSNKRPLSSNHLTSNKKIQQFNGL